MRGQRSETVATASGGQMMKFVQMGIQRKLPILQAEVSAVNAMNLKRVGYKMNIVLCVVAIIAVFGIGFLVGFSFGEDCFRNP